jgi:multidrug efflux pump subunit AcrA (membrane-fusion protein)
MKPKAVFAVVIAFAGLGAACASSFPPPNVPDARLHLQLAEEDLQKAKELIGTDDDKNRRALSLTEVARTEAQLALSLAKQAEADGQARQAQADLAKASTK